MSQHEYTVTYSIPEELNQRLMALAEEWAQDPDEVFQIVMSEYSGMDIDERLAIHECGDGREYLRQCTRAAIIEDISHRINSAPGRLYTSSRRTLVDDETLFLQQLLERLRREPQKKATGEAATSTGGNENK